MGAIANTRLMILGCIVAAAQLLRFAGAFGGRVGVVGGRALKFGGGVLRPKRGEENYAPKPPLRVEWICGV